MSDQLTVDDFKAMREVFEMNHVPQEDRFVHLPYFAYKSICVSQDLPYKSIEEIGLDSEDSWVLVSSLGDVSSA